MLFPAPASLRLDAPDKREAMPDVSVVIPVFNGAAFVDRAIRSVLNQTIRDVELLVVDDGSTDDTPDVVKAFTDPRLNYLRKTHGGPNSARNLGIRHSRLGFLDCDDWWLPDKLEAQLDRSRAAPDAGFIYCSANTFDLSGNLLTTLPARIEGYVLKDLLLGNEVTGSGSSAIVRRQVFRQTGLFNEQILFAEDWEMWLRIAAWTRFAKVSQPLTCITVRPGSHGHRAAELRDARFSILEAAFGTYAASYRRMRRHALAEAHYMSALDFHGVGQLSRSRLELLRTIILEPTNPRPIYRLVRTFVPLRRSQRRRKRSPTV